MSDSQTGADIDSLKKIGGNLLVFETTHLTMKAESLLKSAGISHKLFPNPRKSTNECGLVIKVLKKDMNKAVETCKQSDVTIKSILNLP